MCYLKKKKMYELAVANLGLFDVPKCRDCFYRFHGGFEWLKFSTPKYAVQFSVANGGKWARVVFRDENDLVVRDEVLKDLKGI